MTALIYSTIVTYNSNKDRQYHKAIDTVAKPFIKGYTKIKISWKIQ